MIRAALARQIDAIKNHKLIFAGIVVAVGITCYTGYRHDTLKQAIAYFCAMWLSMLVTDIYTLWNPANKEFPVKNASKEAFFALLCIAIGVLSLLLRFDLLDWTKVMGLIKIAIAIPLILFVFPIGLAIVMLLQKYKPADLGLRWQGMWLVIPIVLIVSLTAHFFAPNRLTWDMLMKEQGNIFMLFFTGVITAGLSEEFTKMILMTRLGKLWNNYAAGWFASIVIWAFLHAPKWYGENNDIVETCLSSIRIIPIGLMWTYVTYRTKSILPATLIHGTNFWGLQNF